MCAPKKAWLPEGHPPSTPWVRESHLLDGLTAFLATNVFGPYRRQLLDANLRTIDHEAQRNRQQKIAALRRSIADTQTKSKNLVRSLEVADEKDVDKEFIRDINQRRAELKAQQEALEQQLTKAEDDVRLAPNPALLDYLPVTAVDLADLPDDLSRRLFEALRLEIHYDYNTHTATCRITLLGDTINVVARTTQEAVMIPFPAREQPATDKQPEHPTRPISTHTSRSDMTERATSLAERQRPTVSTNAQVCVVPPAGQHANRRASDQRFSSGMLVIEGSFQVDNPGRDS